VAGRYHSSVVVPRLSFPVVELFGVGNMPRIWLLIAGLLGASGVGLGAYQAHGLEKMLARRELSREVIERRLDNCDTAAKYQLFHALALLGIASLDGRRPSRWLKVSASLFTAGVVAFSGGLYLIVFAGTAVHWAIVPTGGLLLILGWMALAATAASRASE
jgi:uncharacterized membrane protein YgdD (TMEM256/DUF423 family)